MPSEGLPLSRQSAIVSITYKASIAAAFDVKIPEGVEDPAEWAKANYYLGEQVFSEEQMSSDVEVDDRVDFIDEEIRTAVDETRGALRDGA